MQDKIQLLKAELVQQLTNLAKCKRELDTYLSRISGKHEIDNFDKATIGYYLHNFYNGCEDIFISIARTFENNISKDQWHRGMLDRMTLTIEGIRPAVIDRELHSMLDAFRGFRHVFRHCYSFELDWNREKLVLDMFPRAYGLFVASVHTFMQNLDQML
jgi:hypothetical protein